MKYFFFLSALAVAILPSCQSVGADKPKDGYIITGKIEGLPGTKVYIGNPGLKKITDTAEVKDGVFEFKGKATDAEPIVLLPEDAQQPFAQVFLTNDNYKVEGKFADPASIKVTGGKEQTLFDKQQADIKAIQDKLNPIFEKVKTDPIRVDSLRNAFMSEVNESAKKALKENPSSSAALLFAIQTIGQSHDLTEMESVFSLVSPENKTSKLGKSLSDMIAEDKKLIGDAAMDFTQNDVNGKPISLSSYKGKYVLVDFWASWCKPCRAENPNVLAAYNKYKSKNFDVLGVSLDQEKGKWLEAIKADKLTWTHISDLKYFDNAVAKLYNVQAIPFNVLVDPSGKIIAKNLRGAALDNKLAQLLK